MAAASRYAESAVLPGETEESFGKFTGRRGMRVATTTVVKVRDVIALLHAHGWAVAVIEGSHRQFKRPGLPGRITVSGHRNEEIPLGTLRSIYRQAGLDWKGRPR